MSVASVSPHDAEHALMAASALPAGAMPTVRTAASQLGISVWQLLSWMWLHSDVIPAVIKDITAGDWPKVLADIIAAWKASHPAP